MTWLLNCIPFAQYVSIRLYCISRNDCLNCLALTQILERFGKAACRLTRRLSQWLLVTETAELSWLEFVPLRGVSIVSWYHLYTKAEPRDYWSIGVQWNAMALAGLPGSPEV